MRLVLVTTRPARQKSSYGVVGTLGVDAITFVAWMESLTSSDAYSRPRIETVRAAREVGQIQQARRWAGLGKSKLNLRPLDNKPGLEYV